MNNWMALVLFSFPSAHSLMEWPLPCATVKGRAPWSRFFSKVSGVALSPQLTHLHKDLVMNAPVPSHLTAFLMLSFKNQCITELSFFSVLGKAFFSQSKWEAFKTKYLHPEQPLGCFCVWAWIYGGCEFYRVAVILAKGHRGLRLKTTTTFI